VLDIRFKEFPISGFWPLLHLLGNSGVTLITVGGATTTTYSVATIHSLEERSCDLLKLGLRLIEVRAELLHLELLV
jgi:hypothetical protein